MRTDTKALLDDLKLNPRDPNAKLYLARAQIELSEYKEAQKTLEQLQQSRLHQCLHLSRPVDHGRHVLVYNRTPRGR